MTSRNLSLLWQGRHGGRRGPVFVDRGTTRKQRARQEPLGFTFNDPLPAAGGRGYPVPEIAQPSRSKPPARDQQFTHISLQGATSYHTTAEALAPMAIMPQKQNMV